MTDDWDFVYGLYATNGDCGLLSQSSSFELYFRVIKTVAATVIMRPMAILKGKAKKLVDSKTVGEFSPKLILVVKLYFPTKNPERTRLVGPRSSALAVKFADGVASTKR